MLIPMDIACLNYLVECDGSAPSSAIPAKLFAGDIPEGHSNLVDLGLVEHVGEIVHITAAGRKALAVSLQQSNSQ